MKARLPKGMGQGPSNMQGMLKQAQKMQEDMAALQEDLDAREYTVKAGGGVVEITISGTLEVKKIDISPDIVDPDDIETLSDVITVIGKISTKIILIIAITVNTLRIFGFLDLFFNDILIK